MDQTVYLQLLASDPALAIRCGLRFAHFVGLACGLGAATLLDLLLLRFFVREKITSASFEIFHFSTKLVNLGLAILWITGIGFLLHYAVVDPVKLTNEKIWAKLAVVLVLTANGFLIHSVVLPRLRAQIGRRLFDGMRPTVRTAFIISGAISATSWYVPVALGAFPQLNFSVSAPTILSSYALALLAVALTMYVLMKLAAPSHEPAQREFRFAGNLEFA